MRVRRGLLLGLGWCLSVGLLAAPLPCDDGLGKSAQPGAVAKKAPAVSGEEKACTARGGQWLRDGLRGQLLCRIPNRDAGRSCQNNSDCQGRCFAPAGTPVGESVQGKCSPHKPYFGCYAQVEAGRATPSLCVD